MAFEPAPRFEMNTVRSGFIELCETIRDHGDEVEPRGLPCRELTAVTLVVRDPTVDAMPVGLRRKLNPAIGAAEALQLIGGVSTPNLLTSISPSFEQFKDGEVLAGAYGPRIRMQLWPAQQRLMLDADTRQAVVQIWDPLYDMHGASRDTPCTIGFQFLIRRKRLDMHVRMRSNDVWWGWSYDAFQFTQLQLAMAAALGIEPGIYVHQVGSLHLYDRDLETVAALEPAHVYKTLRPDFGYIGAEHFDRYAERARAFLDGAENVNGWYADTLAPYLADS